MLLGRYKTKRASALTLFKRSSSAILKRLSYHTSKKQTLDPIKEAKAPSSDSVTNNSEEPIDDIGISNTLYTVNLVKQKHHKDIIFPDLPPIPQTTGSIDNNSIGIIEKKIELCSILCDFTDPDVDRSAKSSKATMLRELVALVSSNGKFVPDSTLDSLFDMMRINLSRGLPPIPKKYLCGDEEPSMVDVCWPHLSIVYQLLLKYQEVSPKDKRFDNNFIKLSISLTKAPDMNERDNLVTFFNNYINFFPSKEELILKEMSYLLIGYYDKQYDPFCVTPILKILLNRIKKNTQINPMHFKIFSVAVLPLISSQHIFTYYPLLQQIFDSFISCDQSLAAAICRKTMKAWPESKPSKKLLFINMINFLVEKVSLSDFEALSKPLFLLYANCAKSKQSKVVEASFAIWGNVKILPMILDNTRSIFPIVFPAFSQTMHEHWNQKTQNAALNTLKSMHDTDPFMFDELNQNQQKKAQAQPSTNVIHKNWAMVARSAAKANKEFNLAKILAEIQIRFNMSYSNETPNGNSNGNIKNQRKNSNPRSQQMVVSPMFRKI